jgi:predicted  nucleic acid-binding Zn-ribbon protein
MSDTPISDSTPHNVADLGMQIRLLERKLNAANVEIEEKRKDVVWLATEKAKLENYVMRLEEAGDALYGNCDPSRWDSTATAARKVSDQNAWLKAKEDKP